MGRVFVLALLGIGVFSLSCSRNFLPAQTAAAGNGAITAAANDPADPAETQQLGGLEARFESLAKSLAPSVVSISASSQAFDSDDLLRCEDMNPEKLDSLLDRTTRMVGTGLVIDRDGYVLTNEHVVGEAENVWVTTDNGKVYPALVVGTDPRADLAILKVPASNLQPVKFSTENLHRGQWAIALGNPYGLATAGQECISIGVISALDRSLPKLSKKENRLYSGLIQTTTQINPGNSGGPLFDIKGRVIGINTAVILPEKKTNGIGFAIPITPELLASIDDLKQGNAIVYAYLGVSVSTPTARERRDAGCDVEEGVRIETVDKGSPAAGVLKENDFVARIDQMPVHDSDHFVRLVGTRSTERATQILVYRDGRPTVLAVNLGRRQSVATAVTRESRRIRWEGMVLGPVPKNWQTAAGKGDEAVAADRGLVVLAVAERSRFARQGVHEGDVITQIAGRSLADVTDLQQVLNDLPPSERDINQMKMVSGGGTRKASAVASTHD
ncbi:MAG TPA: trypsin-like peptidase domain-containing protein [Tepidisphaeraceae bacterium]|jgi:S1-C subfamily serine protease